MTDRTFRDPSPSRNNAPVFYDQDAPPVPAVPNRYMSPPPPLPVKSIRRPASVEPPERVLSPPPRANGRGVSLDRGPGKPVGISKGTASKHASQLNSVREDARAQARDTVNFSRPMSPTSSPPSSPMLEKRVASSMPPASNVRPNNAANVGRLRDGEIESIQYSLQEVVAAPVKKKKKKASTNPDAAGSHLASGTSGGRATGSAVQSTPQRQTPSLEPAPSSADARPLQALNNLGTNGLPKKKKKKKTAPSDTIPASEPRASYASDSDSAISDRSNVSDRNRTYNTRAAGLLLKQPSIVREDREGEEVAEFKLPNSSSVPIEGAVDRSTDAPKAASKKGLANGKPKTQKAAQKATATPPTQVTNLAAPRAMSSTNDTAPAGANEATNRESLSPGRAAHFSSQPTYETSDGIKHQPPARSVSPAKSALKHSPSRGASPVPGILLDSNRRRGPGSEASDTSMVSEEGVRKKKKSVRISFDNERTVVGRAATPPTETDSPVAMSPQSKAGSGRRWLPFGKDKSKHASTPSKDEDTIIQPTPVLPSFGSVRGRGDPELRNVGFEQQQQFPSAGGSELGVSADHRVGNIISRVFAADDNTSKIQPPEGQMSSDPLPPEVTSVEGSGYHSDAEGSVYSDQDQRVDSTDSNAIGAPLISAAGQSKVDTTEPTKDVGQEAVAGSLHTPQPSISVPSIAVQPATPRYEQAPTFDTQRSSTGIDQASEVQPSAEKTDAANQPSEVTPVDHHPTEPTPASAGISEPEPPAAAANHDPATPVVGEIAQGLRLQTKLDGGEDSDDSNDSIYSDAAEDISDGDGFLSLNAIVESPSASPKVPSKKQFVPENPKSGARTVPGPLARNDSELSEPGPDAGWEKAQQYWSGLSQQRKEQMEHAAVREAANEGDEDEVKPKPMKKITVPKKSAQPAQQVPDTREPPLPPWPNKQYHEEAARSSSSKASGMKTSACAPPKSSTKAPPTAMKKSMRGPPNAPANEPTMRSGTNRPRSIASDVPTMRSSMRDPARIQAPNRMSSPPGALGEPRGGLQKKQRPVSAAIPSNYNKTLGKPAVQHDRAVSLDGPSKAAVGLAAGMARKRPAVAVAQPLRRNDSDSSSSFKKAKARRSTSSGRYTMKRSMRGDAVDETPHTRTMSPAASTRRAFSPASSTGPSMRTSMRDPPPGLANRTKSPSRSFGFGKSKAKATPSASSGPGSRFSSRFADSSDEEDDPIARRSRFVDSSDEDEPEFTPVRGIPRRIDEGDSTDLDDSSDEKIPPKATPAQPPTSTSHVKSLSAAPVRPAQEETPSAQQSKDKEKKKRSFFGGLGSKKTPKAEPAPLPPSSNGPPRQDVLPRPTSPTSLNVMTNLSTSSSPQAKKSPKLQRRISAQQAEKIQMKRGMSDSWPLPQSPGTSTPTMRPSTSDGTAKKKGGPGASGLGREVIAEEDKTGPSAAYADGAAAVAAVAGEKKKKGWFRKAFGR